MKGTTRYAALLALLAGGCSGTEPSPPVGPVAPSGWIYFAESRRFDPPRTVIWRIKPDGSGREQVPAPDEGVIHSDFDISRDGRWLATNRASRLLVTRTDDPGSWHLITQTDLLGSPRWIPSGKGVAASRIDRATGRWRIVLTPIDGSPEMLLVEGEGTNGVRPVEWFPDGDSLIYVAVPQGYRVLRLRDLSTRPLTPLMSWIEPSPSGRFGIDWNPDPIEYETKKYWRLYDLASGQIVAEATHRLGPFRQAWSPDERHFVDACHEVLPPNEPHSLCIYDRATLMPIRTLVSPTAETYLDFPRWIP
jgi:hypothetical protein